MAKQTICNGCGVVNTEGSPVHDIEFTVFADTIMTSVALPHTMHQEGQLCRPCINKVVRIVSEGANDEDDQPKG
jgi:hypothetical protein